MLVEQVFETLKYDIEDLKGIINYKEYGLSEDLMRKQARAVKLNIIEHLDEIILARHSQC